MAESRYELVFEPERAKWSVASGSDLWSLSEYDGLILASYLRLRVVASRTASSTVTRGNAAVLSAEPGHSSVQFSDHLGSSQAAVVNLRPVKVSLAAADWRSGMYDDRWLTTEGELQVVKAREIGLRLYLPDLVGLDDKSVFVTIGDRDIGELVVPRGEVSEHWITLPPDSSIATVVFTCAYAEPHISAADHRDLGVVVVGLNLDRTEWATT